VPDIAPLGCALAILTEAATKTEMAIRLFHRIVTLLKSSHPVHPLYSVLFCNPVIRSANQLQDPLALIEWKSIR
jgi:site-specific recombinase